MIIKKNVLIVDEILRQIIGNGVRNISIVDAPATSKNRCILNIISKDKTTTSVEALLKIHKYMKPLDLQTDENAKNLFQNLFFNAKTYNLSKTGRMKLNQRLNNNENQNLLIDKNDIIRVIKKLISIKNGMDRIDDVDDLSNKKVKGAGELVNAKFQLGLEMVKNITVEKLSNINDIHSCVLRGLMPTKPAFNVIRNFFFLN